MITKHGNYPMTDLQEKTVVEVYGVIVKCGEPKQTKGSGLDRLTRLFSINSTERSYYPKWN